MSIDMNERLEKILLKDEVTDFLNYEADLLDQRRFREWLDLLTEDIKYEVPMRINAKYGEQWREETKPGEEICWFDESKETLEMRVMQIETGVHWAEEPLSRFSHLVSNILITNVALPEVTVSAHFIVYRNRVYGEVDFMVGRRTDTLRKTEDGWKLAGRYVLLDQNVLLEKNLTIPL
jgi:3-phenylpropionate/cinnamic acid dioxygenase small subunit